LRHRNRGKLAEGAVNLLLVSSLLELAVFYDEPFFITTDSSVEIVLENQDEILRGRIDTLVIQEQFWILVVDSKSLISFEAAIPQVLTYMMNNPNSEKSVSSMVTDGSLMIFQILFFVTDPSK
jgi:hypothetical protein